MIQHSNTEFETKVVLKINPVKARFGGYVRLDKSGAPDTCLLSDQGSGGAADHAKGGANVTLTADVDASVLQYTAKAQIG